MPELTDEQPARVDLEAKQSRHPGVHKQPGGGHNDRKAARLLPTGKWEHCEFEELRRGDAALLFERDGTPVEDSRNPGCYVWWVAGNPEQDAKGVWGCIMTSAAHMAKYDPRAKVPDSISPAP